MSIFRWNIAILVCVAAVVKAEEKPVVHGRVVDEQHRAVADADVDFFWRANGSGRDKDGKLLIGNPETMHEFWGHVGEMEPGSDDGALGKQRTDADGRFRIAERQTSAFTLIAMDRERRRGGLCQLPKDYDGTELEIQLGPLVRISGSFASPTAERKLGWAYADIFVPDDLTRPTDFTRLCGCGSFDARFVLWLPVGKYVLHANNDDEDWQLRLVPPRNLTLTADSPRLELGTVTLAEKPNVRYFERQARNNGTLGDYKKLYGQPPPRWHVDAARGVEKDVSISQFKGKWVLLDFWGLSCSVCLRKTMPDLLTFYQQHAADRDRFEILSICIDTEGEVESLADLDRQLQPVIEHVWGGRKIPFPILLDKTCETWLNFGIPGLGFVLLVDPDGNLCEGDLETLGEKLKQDTEGKR
jgi:hypothetical protein